ncbi:PST family polysaccharide transporter [Rhodococcus sp. 27YEA15]|uniref:lipopolysaccharide biosynthesis protein n=1 Tax=Rhodococcus sp. 27YEA15 TaxID=3156259 RepID=UPI003C7E3AF8
MGLGTAAARGSAVTLGGQWVKFVIQFASIAVLARILSPDDFGKMAMVMAVAGAATVVGDFGLSLASIQAKTITMQQRSNLFWINSAIGVILTAITFASAPLFDRFYGTDQLSDLVRAVSVVFLVNGLTVQLRADLTRNMKFVQLTLTEIFAHGTALAVAVAVAMLDHGVWALLAQQVTVPVLLLFSSALVLRWVPGRPTRKADMRSLLSFGTNTMVTQLVTYSSANVDSVALGKLHGSVELGVYDRAYQLFKIPVAQLATPMTRVALPVLSRITDPDVYMAYLVRAQKVLCYVMLGAFSYAAVTAYPLLNLVLGDGWTQAAPIFRILAVGGAFQALSYIYYWIFLSTGRVDVHLRFSLIGRGLMVLVVCIGAVFGSIGTAIGSSVGFVGIWLVYSLIAVPRIGIDTRPVMASALRPMIFFGLTFVVGSVSLNWYGPYLSDIAAMLAAALLFLLLLAAAAGLSKPFRADIAVLAGTVRKVRG